MMDKPVLVPSSPYSFLQASSPNSFLQEEYNMVPYTKNSSENSNAAFSELVKIQDSVLAYSTTNDKSDPAKSPPLRKSTIAVPAQAPFCEPAIMLRLLTYPFVTANRGIRVNGKTSAVSQFRYRECSDLHASRSGTNTSRDTEAVGSQARGKANVRPAANLPMRSNALKDTKENMTNTSPAKNRDRPGSHCREDTISDVAPGNTDKVTVNTINTANAYPEIGASLARIPPTATAVGILTATEPPVLRFSPSPLSSHAAESDKGVSKGRSRSGWASTRRLYMEDVVGVDEETTADRPAPSHLSSTLFSPMKLSSEKISAPGPFSSPPQVKNAVRGNRSRRGYVNMHPRRTTTATPKYTSVLQSLVYVAQEDPSEMSPSARAPVAG